MRLAPIPVFALAFILLRAPGALADTVGVFYVGADAAAGTLPDAVEMRIALAPGVTVRSGAEIAARLTAAGATPAATVARGPGDALLDEAEALFYKGSLTESADKLREADAALAVLPISAAHLRARLIAGLVKFKSSDLAGADGEILRALVIHPDLDATVFPPSFAERVEVARDALPPRIVLGVRVSPATAIARVDGRDLVAGSITVLQGRHQVVATGPGLHTGLRTVEAKSDSVVRVALPAALPPALERALGAALWDDAPWPAGIEALAEAAGLDRVIVVSARAAAKNAPEARAVLWSRGAAAPSATSASYAIDANGASRGLADWCAAALDEKSRTAPKAATKPVAARNVGASRPLTRKPLFWGAVGVGVLAVVAGGAAAASSASSGGGTDGPGTTTIDIAGPGL